MLLELHSSLNAALEGRPKVAGSHGGKPTPAAPLKVLTLTLTRALT